mgnify:CR=1 FL=1
MSEENIGGWGKLYRSNAIANVIKHYHNPTSSNILRKHSFLISIPLIITNTILLIFIYLSNVDNHEVFINYTLFVYLPITLVIVGWLTQVLLVSQRNINNIQYKRFENLFIQMIDACALCEIDCDQEGRSVRYVFINVNQAFIKVTGLKIEDVLGKSVSEVMPEFESYWSKFYGKVSLTGEAIHFENYSESLDKYFEVTAFSTSYRQFAIIFSDVTDKKLAKQRETELEIEKNKNNLLSTVLSNLSHDFRTPISIINTSLYLIERLEDPAKRSEKIKQIKSQAELFERFIKDVIAILNLEYANTTNKTNININDILKDVSNVYTHRMQKSGLTLNMNIDFNIPDIEANPNQMAQAFNNLIENAINFTEDGGLINISTFTKEDNIHIVVEDNGIGIEPEEIPKIFEKFYRIDKARSHKNGGLGLGLAIVKKVVELHNFKICVTSIKGKGTKFDITIPPSAISKKKGLTIGYYIDPTYEDKKIIEDNFNLIDIDNLMYK